MRETKLYVYDTASRIKSTSATLNDRRRLDTLGSTSVKNGIMLPARRVSQPWWFDGGVLDENSNYIDQSATEWIFGGKYEYDGLSVSTAKVIYLGFFYKHWGHFITQCVARLWFVLKNLELLDNYTLAYTSNGDLPDKILDFLKYCGIKESQLLCVTEPTQFAEIIIPDISGNHATYTDEHDKLFEQVIAQALQANTDLKQFDKVFLVMRQFGQYERKDINSEVITDFFSNNGYQLVYTDDCSLARLIYILQHCTHCVCIDGSMPLNMLFARKQAHLILICKALVGDGFLPSICQMRDLSVTFIDCHLTILPALWGPGPTLMAVTKHLIQFAKDNDMKVPEMQNISDAFYEYIYQYLTVNKTISTDGDNIEYTNQLIHEAYQCMRDELHNALTYGGLGCFQHYSGTLILLKKLSYELIYRITHSKKFQQKYLDYKHTYNQIKKLRKSRRSS